MENLSIAIDEISVGAKWWADKLRSGKRPSRNYVSNPNQVSGLEFVMMQLTAKTPKFSDEQIDKFERNLIVEMAHRLKVRNNRFLLHLGTDYHPDDIIDAAATHAGIGDLSEFLPIKTHMWCKRGEVTVSEGYHAKCVHLMGYERALQKFNVGLKLWVMNTNQFRTSRVEKYPRDFENFESKSIEEQYSIYFGGAPVNGN